MLGEKLIVKVNKNMKYTRRQIIESIRFWKKKLNEMDNNVSTIEVKTIDDHEKIRELLPQIVDMIVKTYEQCGGYYGCIDPKRLIRTTPFVKIVKNEDGSLASCALYRNVDGSFKIQAYANDSTQLGKDGVKAIILSDVAPYDNWVWGEVSGSVEKYFKKFNGYPLPNELVVDVLNKSPDKIKLMNDGFHYYRIIGDNDDESVKIIFGFPNEETAEKAFALADYEAKRKSFNMNTINDSSNDVNENESNDGPTTFKGACSFVNQLSDLYDEEGWRQLTPGLSSMLNTSIEILKNNIDKAEWVKMTLDDAMYLREHMPGITLIKNTLKL